jgi:hypothetical protein
MPDIEATNPVEVPAVAAKVYDKWVVERLVFEGDGITRPLAAEAFLLPGARDDDGKWELYPGGRKNIFIPDVWAIIPERPDMAAALVAVQSALEAYGKEQGIL